MINVLSKDTIDKIAAGEVVERPASCIKELCENSIDAGAKRINVEIKGGGIDLMRVSDDGCGIKEEDLPLAFMRHATSKIKDADDLMTLSSLGFRGEALSSISAVSRIEMITKTPEDMMAVRYESGEGDPQITRVGAPGGTTIIVRDLFYNTPVRRKFLKSAASEGALVAQVMEHLALSHPEIAFSFVNSGRNALETYGNGRLKDVIYRVFGREVSKELIEIDSDMVEGYIAGPSVSAASRNREIFFVNGRFVKDTRIAGGALESAFEPFMMQHRFPFAVLNLKLMPDWVDVNIHPQKLEVRYSDNTRVYEMVKECVRDALFHRELIPEAEPGMAVAERIRTRTTDSAVGFAPGEGTAASQTGQAGSVQGEGTAALQTRQAGSVQGEGTAASQTGQAGSAPGEGTVTLQTGQAGSAQGEGTVTLQTGQAGSAEWTGSAGSVLQTGQASAGAGDTVHMASQDLTALFAHEPDRAAADASGPDCAAADAPSPAGIIVRPIAADTAGLHPSLQGDRPRPKKSPLPFENNRFVRENAKYGEDETYVQGNLFEEGIFTPEAKDRYLIIGQVFDTYWIVQCDDHMLMVDQHAAHEKVLYERFVKQIKEGGAYSQQLMPPRVVSLSAAEEEILLENMSSFTELGFEIEHFGGRDYALRAVPENLAGVDHDTVFSQMLASLLNSEGQRGRSEAVKDRIATMACKAAVKGNNSLTRDEFLTLLDEMMKLDNPYNCPHGRPTMIRMSKYEIEKRFKRIL